jgi:hypothetical protein
MKSSLKCPIYVSWHKCLGEIQKTPTHRVYYEIILRFHFRSCNSVTYRPLYFAQQLTGLSIKFYYLYFIEFLPAVLKLFE